jgi:hypothetical protein
MRGGAAGSSRSISLSASSMHTSLSTSPTTSRPGPGGNGPQRLTPLQLLDRLAALVPPPRIHRHRHFGTNDRSPENSVATLTVSSWPISAGDGTELICRGARDSLGGRHGSSQSGRGLILTDRANGANRQSGFILAVAVSGLGSSAGI